MQKMSLLVLSCLVAGMAHADLSEDFNSLASGSWSTETEVQLPSGIWTFGGDAQRNSSNSVVSIKFNSGGAYMITPAIDSLASVEFKYRSGGSNKKVEIAYRLGSGDWQPADTLSIASSSSAFSSYSLKLGLDSARDVRVRIKGLANNVYIDDVVLKNPVQGQGGGGGGTVIPGEPDPEFTRPTYTATHATYYISPEGNDNSGDGSFEKPWYNLGKALSVAQAGDVIFCRGGRYLMSWRGTDPGAKPAELGHHVVMAPTTYCYFDYLQSEDARFEPTRCGGFIPVEKVYSLEPAPDSLSAEARQHVIGVQANLWSEYLLTEGLVEYQALPRMSALAEVQWTQPARKDYEAF